MLIDILTTKSGKRGFVAVESTYDNNAALRTAGFWWHPLRGCFNSERGRPCVACDLKLDRKWWTDSAAKASRFRAYLTPAALAAVDSPEAAEEIAATQNPSIVIDWNASGGFWYCKPPRGAHAPLKEVGWLFCGDDAVAYPSVAKTEPWKQGMRLVWYTLSAAFAAPFEANMTQTARNELRRRSEDVALSRTAGAEQGDLLCPKGVAYRPFQNVGIRFGCARRGTLLGDDMGLGKTIQAIGITNQDPDIRTVIVLSPKSVIESWRRHFALWSVKPVTVYDITDEPNPSVFDNVPAGELRVMVINPAHTKSKKGAPYMDREWDQVIVDEAHEYRGSQTKRPSGWRGSAQSEAVFGDDGLHVRAKRKLVVITGTGVVNNVAESWPLFRACVPNRWPTFWAFVREQMKEVVTGPYSKEYVPKDLAALQQALRESCMVRREKRDVATELLPKVRVIHPLVAEGEVAAMLGWTPEYTERRRSIIAEAVVEQSLSLASAVTPEELRAAYEGMRRTLKSSVSSFEETSTTREKLGLLKMPYAVERIKALHAERGKVIIFGHHKSVLRGLRDAIDPGGKRSIHIDGDVSGEDRQELVDAFQCDDKVQYAFLSIRAAGTGLTLTAAQTVLFVEFDWHEAAMAQAEDRAHRIGQEGEVLIEYLVFDGSFDAHMVATFTAKGNLARGVLDDRTEAKQLGERQLEARVMDLSQIEVKESQPVPSKTVEQTAEEQRQFTDERRIARRMAGLPDEIVAVSDEQKSAALGAMRMLADMDPDKAREENDVGFSKSDVYVGHALARRKTLSDAEAAIAARLATKYRRQLGQGLCVAAGGTWAK